MNPLKSTCISTLVISYAIIAGVAGAKSERPATSLEVFGDPSIEVCPTSNCPAPPSKPILSTQVIHGRTTQDAKRAEWLSSLGLFVGTGAKEADDKISGQKVTQYLGVMQARGAGTAWALNTDLVRNAMPGGSNSFGGFEGSGTPGRPGDVGTANGSIGYELDFTNWDADSVPGKGPFTVGQYFHAQGSFTSLSAIYLDANMTPNTEAWDNGIFFNGANVVRQNTIVDASSAHTSLKILGTHAIGFDASQSNADMTVISAREGQSVCFVGVYNCIVFREGRLRFVNKGGQTVLNIDEEGNVYLRGKVVEHSK